jgi:triacylglycerol lipase
MKPILSEPSWLRAAPTPSKVAVSRPVAAPPILPPLISGLSTFESAPVRSSPAPKVATGPFDVTARFDGLYAAAKAGSLTLPADADKYVYLMVPGFMAPKSAMKPNLEALKAAGLDARMTTEMGLDVKGDVEANGKALAEIIRKVASETGKQVVPIVHSSGAPELQAALVADPGVKDDIRCAVSLSGTWGGTPLASKFDGLGARVKHVLGNLAEKVGIDTDGISDVSVAHRREYLAEHPYPKDLRTLTVATSFEHGFSFLDPLVRVIDHVKGGGTSDGMVPTRNQVLPGQPVVYLHEADHTDTIMHRPFSKQDPEALTLAAVSLALGG